MSYKLKKILKWVCISVGALVVFTVLGCIIDYIDPKLLYGEFVPAGGAVVAVLVFRKGLPSWLAGWGHKA